MKYVHNKLLTLDIIYSIDNSWIVELTLGWRLLT